MHSKTDEGHNPLIGSPFQISSNNTMKNLAKKEIMQLFGKLVFLAVILSLILVSCSQMNVESTKPLQTVAQVDLNRYIGTWYEIARYNHRFQEGCVGSMATYSLRDDGKINVLNECYEGSFSGKHRSAKGKAWVVDKVSNAKLKVSFFWPFSGDYWIIDLGKDYEYAVIGHPKRKYLWILSRTPQMDENVYQDILNRLKNQDYDVSKLLKSSLQED